LIYLANAYSSKDTLSNAILKKTNNEDPFNILTEEELQREWSIDSSENIVQSAQSLQHSFQDVSYLEIVLVTDRDTTLYVCHNKAYINIIPVRIERKLRR
jgi:hypothetical protein